MSDSDAIRALEQRTVPRDFRAERNQALHRVLRRLPADFLVALIEGLDQADVIEPGRLFAGRDGGCAVGVTMRAIDPRYRGRRLLWGRRVRRSIRSLRRSLAVRIPHLYALEQVFDQSVALAQERSPWLPQRWVARLVASWVADEARTELVLREMSSDWMDRILSEITSPAPALAPVRAPVLATAR